MEKLAGVLCALHALPSAYAAQLLLWLGEEAGIFLQQKHKMTHGLYTFLHLGYTHIYIIIYNYTYIYNIVELRTPATPVGVGGGKERGGCHLNLRT